MAVNNGDTQSKELRLGLVMYGGVSLAIYIYGVAYEFLRLAREEGEYRELTRRAGVTPVLDIISGTSAGGINGLMLAKALAVGGDLSPLKTLWIEEGDLDKLVNTGNKAPTSLLDSAYYTDKLWQAMKEVENTKGRYAPPVFPLDLFITATDLDGVVTEWGGPYFDRPILTKQYGTVFHFKVRPRYNLFRMLEADPLQEEQIPWPRLKKILHSDWSERNDFDPAVPPRGGRPEADAAAPTDKDYYLARVAAATSAFPVAFAPVRFSAGEVQMLKALFAADTLGGSLSGSGGQDQAVVFGDGGMVNNKPFDYTIRTIFHRHAGGPVDRKLVFIEPDPVSPGASLRLADRAQVDGFDSLQGFFSASFYESITADLASVMERNRRIEEVQAMLISFEKRLKVFLKESGRELRAGYRDQPIYPAYRQLKIEQVRQELEDRLFGPLHGEASGRSLPRQMLRDEFHALLEQEYGDFQDEEKAGRFLQTFDYPFRIRRIRYFINKINDWLRELNSLAEVVEEADRPAVDLLRKHLTALKARLYVFVEIYNHQVWHIWAVGVPEARRVALPGGAALADVFGRLREAYGLLMGAAFEAGPVEEESPLDYKALTLAVLKNGQLAQVVNILKELRPKYPAVEALLDNMFDNWRDDGFDPGVEVEQVFNAYEFLDMYLYPAMLLADIGEADPIEVIRVSPNDASRYRDTVASKLAGEKLMHFSAFLKKSWRENDVLWGRLDAAEIIVRTLLPDGSGEDILARLCQNIIQEEFRDIVKRRKSQVSQAFLAGGRQAEIDAILAELTGEEAGPAPDGSAYQSQSLSRPVGLKNVVAGGAVEAENFFKQHYTVGAESLKDVPQDYLLETTAKSLRTVEKMFQQRSEQTQAAGLKRLMRGFGLLLRLPYTFLVTLGGAEESRLSRQLIQFVVLSSIVLLALHGFGAIQAQRWLLLLATGVLVVRYWDFVTYLMGRWGRYSLLFIFLFVLLVLSLFWSGAIVIQDARLVRYAGVALVGLFLLVGIGVWLRTRAGKD